jgi:sigma-B regulation protein RsbU (phosphoserine phosphatase)
MNIYFDKAPCFYFSCTDEGKLVEINETACTTLGYTKQELQGEKLDIIFTIATSIFHQTHFFPLLKMQGHANEIFISLQKKNKEEIPVLINAQRIILNDEAALIYTGIVVHNRKKFENELIAAKKSAEAALRENTALEQARQDLQKNMELLDLQIQQVNKQNEELKQFNHVVTHDLQEPLRKLSVFANLFLESPEKKDQHHIAEKIVAASEKMRSLLSGLQQYVWLNETAVAVKQINLNVLLLQAAQRLKKEIPEEELIVESEDLPLLQADEAQIKLLLYHLLANVIRFKKPGTAAHAKISGDVVQRNKFQHIHGKYVYADFLKLQVSDEGMGFNAKYIAQAFELFKRLHHESGLGSGLSLCKKIAENHHGSISIETAEGEGTTVTVWLPLKND